MDVTNEMTTSWIVMGSVHTAPQTLSGEWMDNLPSFSTKIVSWFTSQWSLHIPEVEKLDSVTSTHCGDKAMGKVYPAYRK